jgi:putative ABC transport system permease protein
MSTATFQTPGQAQAPAAARGGIMRRLTLRNLWSHKRRLLTSFVSVMLGVSFLVGVNVLTNSIQSVFDDLFTRAYAGVDAQVRGTKTVGEEGPYSDGRKKVSADLVEKIRAVDGVAAAEIFIQGKAQIIDKKGKLVAGNAPTFGDTWLYDAELNPYRLFGDSRAPKTDDEIVIDRASAKKAKVSNGDRIKVNTKAGTSTYLVVGQATFGSSDGALGSTDVFFTPAAAQKLINEPGSVDSIYARAKPGITEAQLQKNIAAATKGSGVEVITGDKLTEETQNVLKTIFGFLGTALTAFALVSMFVSIFVIYNAFSIVAAQRTKETALLRAVGATGGQILRSQIAESLLIGVVASALGVLFGLVIAIALKGVFSKFGGDLPSGPLALTPGLIVAGMLLGILVTLFSSLVPAWRASRVPPLAAMRDVSIDRSGSSRKRVVGGTVLLIAGIALLVYGWGLKGSSGATVVGIAAGLCLIGVITLGPILAGPLARVFGTSVYGVFVSIFGGLLAAAGLLGAGLAVKNQAPVLVILSALQILIGVYLARTGISSFRTEGRIARRNAMRNPQRTSATALALTIGVSLVSFLLVFANSFQYTLTGTIDKQVKSDLIVTATDGDAFTPTVATNLAKVPGVQKVTPLRFDRALIRGKERRIFGLDPTTVNDLVDFGTEQGSLEDLAKPNTIAVAKESALSNLYFVGQKVDGSFGDGKQLELEIVAIYGEPLGRVYYLTGLETMAAHSSNGLDAVVLVKSDGRKGVKAAAEDAIADVPNAKLQTKKEYKSSQIGQLAQFLGLLGVLLMLSIVIAVLGIANTLILSIYERTREIGLMRAVGMAREQVKSAVRWEAIVVATIGAALVHVLGKGGTLKLQVPWLGIILVTLLASVVGIIAARKPAKRASKLNVLEAIATE